MTRIIRVCLKPFRAAYRRWEERCTPLSRPGGKQYRVAPGDTIRIERVEGKIGEKVSFGNVLAIHGDKKVFVGAEAEKATVTGKIVQQGRAKKLTVLKYKRNNQYKIQRGHRQNFTAVQVSDIKI